MLFFGPRRFHFLFARIDLRLKAGSLRIVVLNIKDFFEGPARFAEIVIRQVFASEFQPLGNFLCAALLIDAFAQLGGFSILRIILRISSSFSIAKGISSCSRRV